MTLPYDPATGDNRITLPIAGVRTPVFSKAGEFFKVDETLGIAYGWAIVCEQKTSKGWEPYFDLQGDHIPEDAMAAALMDFSKSGRSGKDQHRGAVVGEHVFLYPVTKETAAGLGFGIDKTGAIVGWKPDDSKYLDMIKRGERTGFSIGGLLLEADTTEVGKELAKSYGGKDGKKKRVFRAFKINEISQVDFPAQEPALISVVKRLAGDDLEKAYRLTDPAAGHQHVVCLDHIGDDDASWYGTSYDYAEGADDSHNHKVMLVNGKIVLSMNAGHSHTFKPPRGWTPKVPEPPPTQAATGVTTEQIALAVTPEPGTETLTTAKTAASVTPMATVTQEAFDALQAQLRKSQRFGLLNDPLKAFYARLDPAAQDAFLDKGRPDQVKEMEGSVIGKAADGTVFFLGQEQLWALTQQNEALSKRLDEATGLSKAAEAVAFAKSTIAHLAGEDTHKAALATAVLSISDAAVRTAVTETLKAADAAVALLEKAAGHNKMPEVVTKAEDAYYQGRDAFAKANNMPLGSDVEKARATKAFNATPQGAQLYKSYRDASTPSVTVQGTPGL
jgi:hypothetical protein